MTLIKLTFNEIKTNVTLESKYAWWPEYLVSFMQDYFVESYSSNELSKVTF